MAESLFDVGAYQRPPDPDSNEKPLESAQRRRTQRQAAAAANGLHPLGVALGWPLRLHPDAAPTGDRLAPGRRCGSCRFRELMHGGARQYPKCLYGWDGSYREPPRATHGAGTDVRAWWPACPDHDWGDPKLSRDAARWTPEEATP